MIYKFNLCGLAAAGVFSLLLSACDSGANQPDDSVDAMATEVPVGGSAAEPEATPANKPDKTALREKAKTDPNGADAEAINAMGRNELFATAINTAGYLCARVTDMYPSNGGVIVHCIENRDGSGRVKYRVDASAGTVEQL